MDPSQSNGDGSSSPHSSNLSTRKSHNVYSDLANKWAPNAFSKQQKDSLSAFAQVSLFVLALGVVTSLGIMYFWADAKIALAQGSLEPKTTFSSLKEPCPGTESLIDFASAVNGGSVVPSESSQSYHGALLVPSTQEVFSDVNGLGLLIDDNNSRAHCWAFEGKRGHATIRLGRTIIPKHFSLVHVNVRLMQLLSSTTAPKQFSIYNAEGRLLLGSYKFEFDLNQEVRENTQVFACKQQ